MKAKGGYVDDPVTVLGEQPVARIIPKDMVVTVPKSKFEVNEEALEGFEEAVALFIDAAHNLGMQLGLTVIPQIRVVNEVSTQLIGHVSKNFAINLERMFRNLPRIPGEHIADYVRRNPSALDNFDTRWEYQCYVWGLVTRPIRWLLGVLLCVR